MLLLLTTFAAGAAASNLTTFAAGATASNLTTFAAGATASNLTTFAAGATASNLTTFAAGAADADNLIELFTCWFHWIVLEDTYFLVTYIQQFSL